VRQQGEHGLFVIHSKNGVVVASVHETNVLGSADNTRGRAGWLDGLVSFGVRQLRGRSGLGPIRKTYEDLHRFSDEAVRADWNDWLGRHAFRFSEGQRFAMGRLIKRLESGVGRYG